MGLFDKLKRKNRDDARSARALATIKNPKAIKDDRAGAIEYFKEYGEAIIGVPALLQRFEYSLEHGINDTREKESSMEGVIGYGPEALPLVREHLLVTNRIAWPIKILKALGEERQVVEILKDALVFADVRFDQAKVDKNYDILCYLVEYQLPAFAQKIAHFLADPDERVRFACTELLIEQEDPGVPDLLEPFIGDVSSENTRIRQSVVVAFLRHNWKLKNPNAFPTGHVDGPIFVSAAGQLELRQ